MDERLRKVYFPSGGHGDLQEIRIFNDSAIQRSVDNALRRVHPEKSGAVLKVNLDDQGIAAVMAARLGDNWSMGLVLDRKWTGEMSAGAEVVFEW